MDKALIIQAIRNELDHEEPLRVILDLSTEQPPHLMTFVARLAAQMDSFFYTITGYRPDPDYQGVCLLMDFPALLDFPEWYIQRGVHTLSCPSEGIRHSAYHGWICFKVVKCGDVYTMTMVDNRLEDTASWQS